MALAIRGLSVRYNERTVLSDLDLDVARGTVMGLLGPNGAGKTTLIRAICGRVRRRAGSILVGGEPEVAKARRFIGLVPQEIALFQHLTARENLVAFGSLSGLSGAQVRNAIDWAADATALATRLDDHVSVLSSGWRRRVNICAAILHKPVLLILDEPTVGIDMLSREWLAGTMRRFADEGMGILLATHDLEGAEVVCDRVGFLNAGRIERQGDPRELIRADFGDHSEVVVTLHSTPSAAQRITLEAEGYRTVDNGSTWTVVGSVRDGANEIAKTFTRNSLKVREIRIREPGLASLFARLSTNQVGASLS
jgi:ABC-2 type transport system ATP-binding protein